MTKSQTSVIIKLSKEKDRILSLTTAATGAAYTSSSDEGETASESDSRFSKLAKVDEQYKDYDLAYGGPYNMCDLNIADQFLSKYKEIAYYV